MRSKLRIATCLKLPEPDPDEAPLDAALSAANIDAAWIGWDDPAADWDAPVPTLVRTTWNYAAHLDAFLAWIDRTARAAPIFNPPDVMRLRWMKSSHTDCPYSLSDATGFFTISSPLLLWLRRRPVRVRSRISSAVP